jgi:hypothetical protein
MAQSQRPATHPDQSELATIERHHARCCEIRDYHEHGHPIRGWAYRLADELSSYLPEPSCEADESDEAPHVAAPPERTPNGVNYPVVAAPPANAERARLVADMTRP